jgi:hypothetical protein
MVSRTNAPKPNPSYPRRIENSSKARRKSSPGVVVDTQRGAHSSRRRRRNSPPRVVRRFCVDSRSSGEEFTMFQSSPRQSSHTATAQNVSRAHQTLDQGPSGAEHQCRWRRRRHNPNRSPSVSVTARGGQQFSREDRWEKADTPEVFVPRSRGQIST